MGMEKLLPGEVLKIYELASPNRTPPWPTLFNFISCAKNGKEILSSLRVSGIYCLPVTKFICCCKFTIFSLCCQVAHTHSHTHVLVRFPFDFYFVSKLQLFGNCFYNTTKTLKGTRRSRRPGNVG